MFTPGPSVAVVTASGASNVMTRKFLSETIVLVNAIGLCHAAIDFGASIPPDKNMMTIAKLLLLKDEIRAVPVLIKDVVGRAVSEKLH